MPTRKKIPAPNKAPARRVAVRPKAAPETLHLTAVVIRESKRGYSASCNELPVASQGTTVEKAIESLREAIDLYFETHDDAREMVLPTAMMVPFRYEATR